MPLLLLIIGGFYAMIGKTISHYKIVDKLGEGGMGSVWKAEDTTLQRLVAIKALSRQLAENEEARERFVREAQAASALNHANITTVYELLEDEGEQFIAMEYVEGKTIRDIVESGHVSIRKALDIIIQAAEALDAAHNKGILHRDIKSANIMVSMEGNVKVMDFGLAHLEERSQLTRTGTTMGTLAYSSPEQLTGAPVDRKSEVFSLGCVFYELLTGQLPFKSSSEGELVFEIINTEQDRPSKLRDDVPEKVDGVVARMLEKKPELRYGSCGELLTDLKAIRSELETTTVQISTGQVPATQAWLRRPAVILWMVGIAAVIALLLFILPRRSSERPSLAILPAENLGGPEYENLVSGLATVIGNQLAYLSGLEVRPYRSPDLYDYTGKSSLDIGHDLHAEHLLKIVFQVGISEGGSRIFQIDPQLIQVTNDQVIPVNQIQTTSGNILQVQTELARELSRLLKFTITTADEVLLQDTLSENNEAVEYYLRGLHYYSRKTMYDSDDFQNAVSNFTKAIECDSTFAHAWAYLSLTHGWSTWGGGDNDLNESQRAAEKAFRLNPGIPESHVAMGYWYLYHAQNYKDAVDQFSEACDLRPDDAFTVGALADAYRRIDDWEKSLEGFIRATELEPMDQQRVFNVAQDLHRLRRYDEAEEYYLKAIPLLPDARGQYYELAILYHSRDGDRDRAEQLLRDAPDDVIFGTVGGRPGIRARILIRLLPDVFLEAIEEHEHNVIYFLAKAAYYCGTGQLELATANYDSVRIFYFGQNPPGPPDSGGSILYRALALAGSGHVSEAAQYAAHLEASLEDPFDALLWRHFLIELAHVYTLIGDFDAALQTLEDLLSTPSLLSRNLLILDPAWDPLRENPRFQALLRKYR